MQVERKIVAGGQGNNLIYEIKFSPANPLDATAKVIYDNVQTKILSTDIQWHAVDKIDSKTIRTYLFNEIVPFNVFIEIGRGSAGFIVHINLKKSFLPPSPSAPGSTINWPLSILSIKNASELVLAYKQQYDPLFPEIARRMFFEFQQLKSPSKNEMSEIEEIAEFLCADDREINTLHLHALRPDSSCNASESKNL